MAVLKPCPNCGKSGKKLVVNRICFDGTWTVKLGKYFIECPKCHWCGKTKVFLWRAKRAWNTRTPQKEVTAKSAISALQEASENVKNMNPDDYIGLQIGCTMHK